MNRDEHDDDYSADDEFEHDDEEFEGVYVVDDETADLIASAIGVLQMMSQIQMGEDHRENLLIVADELSARFAIEKDSMAVEEVIIDNPETGEQEILYRPPGGVFGDLASPEAEGPAENSE